MSFKKFYLLKTSDKLLFLEALATQYLVWIFVSLIPFKVIVRLLQDKDPKSKSVCNDLMAYRRAILRATRFAFWKNICLIQSISVKLMLYRRNIPSELFIGTRLDENKHLLAHAWLISENQEIVKKSGDYKMMLKI